MSIFLSWLIYYIHTKYILTYPTFHNKLLQLLVCQITHKNIFICLAFPKISAIFGQITIFGNVHRPCLFLCSFFSWLSGYISPRYFIWKCAQTTSTVPLHVNDSLHHFYYFFLLFHDFSTIFAQITIFGNVHRPQQSYLNIADNSSHCVYYFSWFWGYIHIHYYI